MMARPSSSADTANFRRRRLATLFFGIGRNEAIAPADHRLKILRFVCVVVQGTANLADRRIDSLLNVNEDILAPQLRRRFPRGSPTAPVFRSET